MVGVGIGAGAGCVTGAAAGVRCTTGPITCLISGGVATAEAGCVTGGVAGCSGLGCKSTVIASSASIACSVASSSGLVDCTGAMLRVVGLVGTSSYLCRTGLDVCYIKKTYHGGGRKDDAQPCTLFQSKLLGAYVYTQYSKVATLVSSIKRIPRVATRGILYENNVTTGDSGRRCEV